MNDSSDAPSVDVIEAIIRRVKDLICYEKCRAVNCKDSEHCCGGGQCPPRDIAEREAHVLLRPLLTTVQNEDGPGSPIGRLNVIADATRALGLCSGNEAAAPETFLIKFAQRCARQTRVEAHPLSCLPDCMIPDGAEPCKGYQALAASKVQPVNYTRPHLGLATTGELLDELRARIEINSLGGLDYRTVDSADIWY